MWNAVKNMRGVECGQHSVLNKCLTTNLIKLTLF